MIAEKRVNNTCKEHARTQREHQVQQWVVQAPTCRSTGPKPKHGATLHRCEVSITICATVLKRLLRIKKFLYGGGSKLNPYTPPQYIGFETRFTMGDLFWKCSRTGKGMGWTPVPGTDKVLTLGAVNPRSGVLIPLPWDLRGSQPIVLLTWHATALARKISCRELELTC